MRKEQYALSPVGGTGISGTVFVAENIDSSFNVTIRLNSSIRDSVHVMNIYNIGPNNTRNISVRLSDIAGTGGAVIGETKNIRQAVEVAGNFSSVTYDNVIRKKTLAVVVMLSRHRMDSILCSGEIGH